MLLTEYQVEKEYKRKSKNGKEHSYFRKKTILVFRCDNCLCEFERDKGSMDPKRLSNNYYHVCENCDDKRFAQKKGAERRNVWNMPVSSLTKISKL